jgi:molybdopterin/thiamine biosynthesis adenylyltransferase
LPLPGEDGPADRLNRLAIPLPMSATGTGRCRRRPLPSLALVGAGALGNWFGLALGLAGVPAVLSIYDHDEIEETNLNRQVLFHDAVGEPKAITLADRLHEWFPQLSLSGYAVRVEPATQRLLLESGALVACPDSFAVRALLNRLGRGYRRPLLSGGTSASSGSALVYAPGATACLSCRLRIDQLAEVEQAPARCGQVRQASVVTSNAIVGALLVVLLLGLAANSPEPGTWEYDSHPRNDRLGRHSPWPACTCRTGSGG